MNEKEKQLYEALKIARNLFLKKIDILQKEINQENLNITTREELINQFVININRLQSIINIIQQQEIDENILQVLNEAIAVQSEAIEQLNQNIEGLELDEEKYSYYCTKKKDTIKLCMSNINYIDEKIKTLE